jgi:glutathione S-transferase
MAKGMEMRLYFHPLSSNSRRVTMTAQQLGLKLDLIVIDLLKSEHRDPEFLKFNPNGKVPLLEDGGFYLWESHAIMQYLADRCPDQDLYPREVRARAEPLAVLVSLSFHTRRRLHQQRKDFEEDGGWIRRSRSSRDSTWRVLAHGSGPGARRPCRWSAMDHSGQVDPRRPRDSRTAYAHYRRPAPDLGLRQSPEMV